jgi:hypothetical protein
MNKARLMPRHGYINLRQDKVLQKSCKLKGNSDFIYFQLVIQLIENIYSIGCETAVRQF